jgi:tetratricopeptide (TPR) repeat protein
MERLNVIFLLSLFIFFSCEKQEVGELLGDPTLEETSLYKKAKSYMDDDPYQAIEVAIKAVESGKTHLMTGKFEYLISYLYYQELELPKAAEHAYRAIRVFEKQGDRLRMGRTYHHLGNIYFDNANFDYSIESFKMAAEIRKTDDSPYKYASSLYNLALAYSESKQFHYADFNFKKTLEMFNKYGDVQDVVDNYNALGVMEKRRGRFSDAEDYYYQIIHRIKGHENEKFHLFTAYHNLGRMQLENGDMVDARNNLEKALAFGDGVEGLENSLSANYVTLGKLHQAEGRYEEAKKNFLLALDHGDHFESRPEILEAHAGLKELYKETGNRDMALFHADYYQSINEQAKDRFDKLYSKKTEYGETLAAIYTKEAERALAKSNWYSQQLLFLLILIGASIIYAAYMNWGRIVPSFVLKESVSKTRKVRTRSETV